MTSKEQKTLKAGRPSAGRPAGKLRDLVKNSAEMTRITLDIEVRQQIKLKVFAAQNRKSAAAVVRELIDTLETKAHEETEQ
jgi:hypothetical protein